MVAGLGRPRSWDCSAGYHGGRLGPIACRRAVDAGEPLHRGVRQPSGWRTPRPGVPLSRLTDFANSAHTLPGRTPRPVSPSAKDGHEATTLDLHGSGGIGRPCRGQRSKRRVRYVDPWGEGQRRPFGHDCVAARRRQRLEYVDRRGWGRRGGRVRRGHDLHDQAPFRGLAHDHDPDARVFRGIFASLGGDVRSLRRALAVCPKLAELDQRERPGGARESPSSRPSSGFNSKSRRRGSETRGTRWVRSSACTPSDGRAPCCANDRRRR